MTAHPCLQEAGISWNDAYGKFLGTNLICAWITVIVSFLPTHALRKLFPSWIAGLTVFLVGVSLLRIGMQNWGGGYACAQDTTQLCEGNGGVKLPYGSISYLGLGAVCFLVLLVIEIFGSPFLRNCEIILALLVGCAGHELPSEQQLTALGSYKSQFLALVLFSACKLSVGTRCIPSAVWN